MLRNSPEAKLVQALTALKEKSQRIVVIEEEITDDSLLAYREAFDKVCLLSRNLSTGDQARRHQERINLHRIATIIGPRSSSCLRRFTNCERYI